MYTSYSVAETIKKTAIARRVPVKTVLTDLGLGKNTLSNMYNGSMLRSDTLARIADYLDCSVDYLLGRTDTPECSDSPKGNYVSNVNSDNNTIEQNYNAQSKETSASPPSKECAELVRIYTTLPFRQQVRLLSIAVELEQES